MTNLESMASSSKTKERTAVLVGWNLNSKGVSMVELCPSTVWNGHYDDICRMPIKPLLSFSLPHPQILEPVKKRGRCVSIAQGRNSPSMSGYLWSTYHQTSRPSPRGDPHDKLSHYLAALSLTILVLSRLISFPIHIYPHLNKASTPALTRTLTYIKLNSIQAWPTTSSTKAMVRAPMALALSR